MNDSSYSFNRDFSINSRLWGIWKVWQTKYVRFCLYICVSRYIHFLFSNYWNYQSKSQLRHWNIISTEYQWLLRHHHQHPHKPFIMPVTLMGKFSSVCIRHQERLLGAGNDVKRKWYFWWDDNPIFWLSREIIMSYFSNLWVSERDTNEPMKLQCWHSLFSIIFPRTIKIEPLNCSLKWHKFDFKYK
jgi:hypothetical protein